MPFRVRKVGRLQVNGKSSLDYKSEIFNNDRMLSVSEQSFDFEKENDRETMEIEPVLQGGPPVKEPENEPKKPPVKEPGKTPDPLPPPNHPPVEEPPNKPGGPPVKEPPPDDPNREPVQKPTVMTVMLITEQDAVRTAIIYG